MLQTVSVQDVWRSEARDFTPWLEENINILAERLGKELEVLPPEKKKLDGYEVDIIARDEDGNKVIIENQFGRSDHDHLGKLLLYLRLSGARTGIWVCENPRPEHIEIVSWLNESLRDISLYLIKLEVFKIGDSLPAPLFTILVAPSKSMEEIPLRYQLRRKFWKGLLDKSNRKTKLFARISPSMDSWISTGAGKSGLSYAYVIRIDGARVELYISTKEKSTNKRIFDELYSKKKEIEKEFGEELEWQRLDDKRACRIAKNIKDGGLKDKESWSSLQDRMVESDSKVGKRARNT